MERYAIHDEFAAGGMATVHFARLLGAQGFRRTVAAKRLLPHLTRDQDLVMMLVDEARLASRVRHPNVVSTLDVVQTADELVLVMDYVHGDSVAKLARAAAERGESVPLPIAAAIAIDTLHGLHAAHEAKDERGVLLGLVHRDVSPQNVLVGTDGVTRIADFGIAKAAGRSQTTRDGALKGKLAYMAPEQINQGVVSRATDLFAATIMLWELLTGERLFEGSTHAETVFKVMTAPIAPPSSRRAGLPPALDAIVARGLERSPEARFATARDMARAIEACAPAIRPSEIAAWVERVGAEALGRRAAVLAVIEHAHEHGGAPLAHARPSAAGPAAKADVTTGSRRVHRPSLDGFVATAHASEADDALSLSMYGQPRRRRTGLVIVAALLAVAAAAGWLTLSSEASPPRAFVPASAQPAAPRLPSIVTPASMPAERATPSPSREPEAAEAPRGRGKSERARAAANDAISEQAVDAATPSSPSPSASPPSPATPAQRRSRTTRGSSASACDPPYSIDASGRVLFKPECM